MQASLLLRRLRKLDAYVMRLCARIVHGAPPAHRARPSTSVKQASANAVAVPQRVPVPHSQAAPHDDYPKTVFLPGRPLK